MPLPIKTTWSFRRTPNANGKKADDLDRAHQTSSSASLKAERSHVMTSKSNRHSYSCESLQVPDPPPSPILNDLPPAVPPKTSCDPACNSHPRAITSASKEPDITEIRRVPSFQVLSEDTAQPFDNALLSFSTEIVAEMLSPPRSPPSMDPRQQTNHPVLAPEGLSAQVLPSHPLLTSSDHTASEVLITRDPALSVESEHPPGLVRSVETRSIGVEIATHFEDASSASKETDARATSDAELPPKAVPAQPCDAAPSPSELVLETPTTLSALRPSSLIGELPCVENSRLPLATTSFAPSADPLLSQNNFSSDHSPSRIRTCQPKHSSKLQQPSERLKPHLPSQRSWQGPLTSRRAGRNVSQSMDSCSPDSRSSEASGCYMTDAATVVRRLFNNPLYSDLALSVDETTFRVHRGILAEHCSYFRKLFDNARSRNPTTEIKRVDCTFKPVAVERARQVKIARAKKVDHGKKVGETSPSRGREECHGGSEFTSDGGCKLDRRDMPANSCEGDTKDTTSNNLSLTETRVNADMTEKESGSTLSDNSSSWHSEESQRSAPPASSSSRSSTENLKEGAQLYGILEPSELDLVDLLSVLRIGYLYGVPGLISVLADRIYDSLRLSVETWPAAIRFADRYQLQDIRRRALEHASADKSLWKLAVEMLRLEDFKVFLRGIGQAGVGRDYKAEDLRGVKDELLMMFLLVHYQEATTAVSPSSSPVQATSRSSSSSPSRAPVCYFSDDLSLVRRDYGGSEGLEPVRPCSRDGHKSNSSRIRQQLLQQRPALMIRVVSRTPSLRTRFSSEPLRWSDQVGSRTLDLNMVAVGGLEQSLCASVADPAPMDKAGNATSWMRGVKRECGWDGKLSYLD
ncbi:hypothetical protein BGZ75_007042 [Mortierella antarctica]|nr:hypothetical protein BGZ75_007042 [Mortierella antarctica]